MGDKMMDYIMRGTQIAPRRIMLYGTHGIGKSTFGSMAPEPIFIQTEEGLNDIECAKFPLAESYEMVEMALSELLSENHKYRTIVIDTLDWLESLIWKRVCKDRNVANIEEIGYAKGYTFALTYWREILDRLNGLRYKHDMTVILVAHAKVEKFENPAGDNYDRYCPRLHKHASAIAQEWCDEILFATYKVYTKAEDTGFGAKKAKGVGDGERVVYATQRPAYLAKNRLGMPDEIPLAWHEFNKYIPVKEKKTDGKS